MSNKLKDIFSDDDFNFNGNIKFKDNEAYRKFLAALQIVWDEGHTIPIEGVESISTEINSTSGKYPLNETENILNLVVGPSIELRNINIVVDDKEKTVTLQYYHIKNKYIIETLSDVTVSLKIIFNYDTLKHIIQYKTQFEKAASLQDVLDGFNSALGIINRLYSTSEENTKNADVASIMDLKKYFNYSIGFLKRILAVNQEIALNITPLNLQEITSEIQCDIEELYLLLNDKKTLRLNSRLTSTETTSFELAEPNKSLCIGNNIKLTFTGTASFQIFDKTIHLYTANLLINAIIKEIVNTENGVKVLYGDVDSNPMYISYKAFKTEEEAQQEVKTLLEREVDYVNALTRDEYIKNYTY